MSDERLITLKRFWTIKIALISFVCLSMILVGYFIGTWKMSLKIQASAMAARNILLAEPSAIGKSYQLIASGVPFCYNQGNIYEAKIIPTKRSLMPLFKTIQAEEF